MPVVAACGGHIRQRVVRGHFNAHQRALAKTILNQKAKPAQPAKAVAKAKA